ncbi:hypothetical protein IWW34DRAFT_791963 [Fusarium oxysporum f. sp. albedinis]|nr:hypothetical protein IWW34DRAFT_791963 [Fusarium oxysporum f. sp. albedinis]
MAEKLVAGNEISTAFVSGTIRGGMSTNSTKLYQPTSCDKRTDFNASPNITVSLIHNQVSEQYFNMRRYLDIERPAEVVPRAAALRWLMNTRRNNNGNELCAGSLSLEADSLKDQSEVRCAMQARAIRAISSKQEETRDKNRDEVSCCGPTTATRECQSSPVTEQQRAAFEDGSEYELDVEQVIKAIPFRAANKRPMNPDSELSFHLHGFAAADDLLVDVNNLSVSIIFKELFDFLNDAEDMRQRQGDRGPQGRQDENAFAKEEEAQETVTKGDRSYSASVGDLAWSNFTTQSASKRPASTDTSDDLPVEKRLTKKPKSQRRRE